MIKIPFEILSIQVEKIYNQEINTNDLTAINKQAEYVCDFVEACGWSWDDFLNESLGNSKLN